jgi:hypothetical protein
MIVEGEHRSAQRVGSVDDAEAHQQEKGRQPAAHGFRIIRDNAPRACVAA